ncbi:TPA: YfjI family protein [Serratia fonticola]
MSCDETIQKLLAKRDLDNKSLYAGLNNYPVDAFPPVMQDIIRALHDDSQIPMEIIGNAVLAAASMACQSLVNVALPHSTTPQPCSLYLLAIAESGEGKTTINKQVMAPFYDFMEELNADYIHRSSEYKGDISIWRLKKKILERNLTSAITHPDDEDGFDEKEESIKLKEHIKNEPKKPGKRTILYEDTTLKTLVDGMAECSQAGFISDEAIIFFKGYVQREFGFLNKAWEGGDHLHDRADGTFIHTKPCLTFSLMAQPKVAKDYFEKNDALAKGVGFLARFLFSTAESTIGNRTDNTDFSRSRSSLDRFHTRVRALLSQQKEHIIHNSLIKKTLTLSTESVQISKQWRNETQSKMVAGKELNHIRDIASKSGDNVARIATIFQFFDNENSTEVNHKYLAASCDIMRWHLEQARVIFYPLSERYQFERDIKEVFISLKDTFTDNNFTPVEFNKLRRCAPNRLRNSGRLRLIFNQLVIKNQIVYAKNRHAGAEYILPVLGNNNVTQSGGCYYVNLPGSIENQQVIPLFADLFVPAQPEPGVGKAVLNEKFIRFLTSKDIQDEPCQVDLSGL